MLETVGEPGVVVCHRPAMARMQRSLLTGIRCVSTIPSVFWVCFRIYNNLPEVKKKKEEQQKRVVLQSNRLRAEVFKKVTAQRPAGVACVWHTDADSELDVFVSCFPSNYWTSSFKGMQSDCSPPC